jgi:N-acetyl-1-D-myo-inositol-2-amino-2-deoxy-alpha-D-glucopyranoside deacetylase
MNFEDLRVAAIFAHPDDESFLIGGAIAALRERGAEVTLISATRGESGEISDSALATSQTLGDVRDRELRDAMAAVDVSDVRFLGYRDSGMVDTPENEHPLALVQQPLDEVTATVRQLVDELAPGLIITFGPEGIYLHPDHIYVHEVVIRAVRDRSSSNAKATPLSVYFVAVQREFFEPLGVGKGSPFEGVPLERFRRMGTPASQIDLSLDVQSYLPAKWAALCSHRTQYGQEGPLSFLQEGDRERFMRFEHFVRWNGFVDSWEEKIDPLKLLSDALIGP